MQLAAGSGPRDVCPSTAEAVIGIPYLGPFHQNYSWCDKGGKLDLTAWLRYRAGC